MEPPKVLQQGGAPGQLAKGGENAERKKNKKVQKCWNLSQKLNEFNLAKRSELGSNGVHGRVTYLFNMHFRQVISHYKKRQCAQPYNVVAGHILTPLHVSVSIFSLSKICQFWGEGGRCPAPVLTAQLT